MYEDLNIYMQKVSEGDKNAFRYIANSLGEKMHSTAVKLMGSQYADEADDALQISLIKLWQSAPLWKKKVALRDMFTASSFLLAWICIVNIEIIRNLLIMMHPPK